MVGLVNYTGKKPVQNSSFSAKDFHSDQLQVLRNQGFVPSH